MNAAHELPLSDIQDLAANYSDRQGLRVIPVGLAVVVQVLPQWPARILGIYSMIVALAAGFVGYWLIGRYYRHRFGSVEELPYQGLAPWAHVSLMFIAVMMAMAVDLVVRPPVFVSGLVIAACLTVTAWPSRRVRNVYAEFAVALAIISLFPLLGTSLPSVARTYALIFGVMLVFAGARDHAQFARLFPPLEQQHEQ